ncbi:MAG: ABC transporter ATP-binding protein/permease [Elainella sp. Prado103]|jgi:ATP-binding cassette subfamily B protein|nr:ABC transporter ATP-binding protein/permease [Elainella sp. Prado103]
MTIAVSTDSSVSSPPTHPLIRLFRYGRPYRSQFWLATLCSVLNKTFDLAPPVLIGIAVDVVVQREASALARLGLPSAQSQLLFLALLTLVIWGLESLFEYAYARLWRNLGQTIQHDLRLDAYAHMQELELEYFESRHTGGLIAILNDDINQLERFLDFGANEVLQVLTTVLLVGGGFWIVAPSIAWMAMLPIPFILWGSFSFQKLLAPRYADVREKVSALSARLSNNLSGIVTIKSFVTEAEEVTRLRLDSEAYRQSNQRAIRLSAAFTPLIRIIILLGFTALLVYGGLEALSGRLTVGVYSMMLFMIQRLLWPLTRLGETLDQYQRAMASTNRVMNLLDTPIAIHSGQLTWAEIGQTIGQQQSGFDPFNGRRNGSGSDSGHTAQGALGLGKPAAGNLVPVYRSDHSTAQPEPTSHAFQPAQPTADPSLFPIRGEIWLKQVSFAYRDFQVSDNVIRPVVIHDLSLHIPAGKTIAIVGSTGSGKSTLVKLLLRLYEIQAGEILLDGVNIRELQLAELRRAIGWVSQDVYLFHGTVLENILYGSPTATLADAIEAAQVAEAHEFIQNLPYGYDTIVGERGQKLSGGQRQRLAIARAVLKNPPILILDEATSAVDNETEAAIQRSLEHITQNRTTIAIAHRLSTIRNADRIYVMEQGKLVEQGTHEMLLEQQGIYANLWQIQMGAHRLQSLP